MQVIRRFVVLFALILLAGCAAQPEQISIAPQPDFGSGAAAGTQVAVKVVDRRNQPTIIGYRAPAEAGLGKAVLARNDVAAAVRRSLTDSLSSLGFAPQAAGNGGVTNTPSLTVTIDTLRYRQRGEGLNKVGSTDVVLIGEARNGGTSFKATYKVHNEDRVGIIQSTEDTQRFVNQALSKVLGNLLQDDRLLAVLRG